MPIFDPQPETCFSSKETDILISLEKGGLMGTLANALSLEQAAMACTAAGSKLCSARDAETSGGKDLGRDSNILLWGCSAF